MFRFITLLALFLMRVVHLPGRHNQLTHGRSKRHSAIIREIDRMNPVDHLRSPVRGEPINPRRSRRSLTPVARVQGMPVYDQPLTEPHKFDVLGGKPYFWPLRMNLHHHRAADALYPGWSDDPNTLVGVFRTRHRVAGEYVEEPFVEMTSDQDAPTSQAIEFMRQNYPDAPTLEWNGLNYDMVNL